jgi:hypothetical protein
MTTINPKCLDCKHFTALEDVYFTGHRCKAFPEAPGIPEEIFWKGQPHDALWPGQEGAYVFEPWED